MLVVSFLCTLLKYIYLYYCYKFIFQSQHRHRYYFCQRRRFKKTILQQLRTGSMKVHYHWIVLDFNMNRYLLRVSNFLNFSAARSDRSESGSAR